MTKEGLSKTAATYLDPAFVRNYAERNRPDDDMIHQARLFVDHLPGKRVIDIGCGPGHHAWLFAEWGYEVAGIDASPVMIDQAISRVSEGRSPEFQAADMRRVGQLFPEDSFDGAWLSASLLHIPKADTPTVLKGVHRIVIDGGAVLISVKQGPQGERLVSEERHGLWVERQFTFWEEANLRRLVGQIGFTVEQFQTAEHGTTGGLPTTWLIFLLKVVKR